VVRSRPTSLAEGVKPRVDVAIAEKRGVRRMSFRWLACVLAVSAAAAGAADAEERVRVALLPLVVRSMDDGAYLRQGLADMLVARLARDVRIAVVPVEGAENATMDLAAARKTAEANGAEHVLYGSFTRFAEGASLELFHAPVRGDDVEPRRIYVHARDMGSLMPLLDGVALRATYAVVGAPAEGPAVSTGPLETQAPARREAIPQPVGDADGAIGNRERRAPGLPSDTEDGVLR
jgi:hypothetical protein